MASIVRGSLRSSLRYQHFENHNYHDSAALIDLTNVKLGTTDNIKIFICRWVSLTIGLGCFSDLKIKTDDAGPKLSFILSAIIVSWIAITLSTIAEFYSLRKTAGYYWPNEQLYKRIVLCICILVAVFELGSNICIWKLAGEQKKMPKVFVSGAIFCGFSFFGGVGQLYVLLRNIFADNAETSNIIL